jgi:cell division protein ZapD
VVAQITYEQPLNERIRTLLRLDHLFKLAEHHMGGGSEWNVRSVLNTLLDINELIGRTDIKSELIKELERDLGTFKALQRNPGVDLKRLDLVLNDLQNYLEELRDANCQPGQLLKQDELVNSIKQRNVISGGTCNFDLPAYHQWLHRPLEVHRQQLEAWQQDLRIVRKSTLLVLNLIRNSSNPAVEIADKGFFQKSLELNSSCQLIRVVLPSSVSYYPEISAGKHRVTVRFMEQPDTMQRPVQTELNVEFNLHCCIL